MNFLLRSVALAITGMTVVGMSEASAQQICNVIAPYFVAAPSKFISERGERLELDVWKMKQDIPKFNCELRLNINLDLEKRHSVFCRVNESADRTVIAAYHETMTKDLQSCIDRQLNRSQWKKDSGREAGDIYEDTYVEWDLTNPPENSRISLHAMRHKRTGREFNSIGWSYRRK